MEANKTKTAVQRTGKPLASATKGSVEANTGRKLFVLDTNVLMHDPTSLFRFEEHDVFLPMVTLEELDQHKKGMSEVARNARQASRFMDEMVSAYAVNIKAGIPLTAKGNKLASGRLFMQTEAFDDALPVWLPTLTADNHILSVALSLQKLRADRHVILV
nr:PhoH family protein [Burkholderiales bacterium]